MRTSLDLIKGRDGQLSLEEKQSRENERKKDGNRSNENRSGQWAFENPESL